MQQKLQPGPHVRLREKHTPPRIPDAGERAGNLRLSGGVLCAAVPFRAVVLMSYSAKDLEEIAALFEIQAQNCERLATRETSESYFSEAYAWRSAARMLRCTTLTEPCHMEKS